MTIDLIRSFQLPTIYGMVVGEYIYVCVCSSYKFSFTIQPVLIENKVVKAFMPVSVCAFPVIIINA